MPDAAPQAARPGDLRIVYTGARPGEKLHEELVGEQETTESTQNGKIQLIRTSPAAAEVELQVGRLLQIAEHGDPEASRRLLFELTGEPVDRPRAAPLPR